MALLDIYYLFMVLLIEVTSWCPARRPKDLLVRGIAWSAYTFSRAKRKTMQRNLHTAFAGRLSDRRARQILRGPFLETWQEIFSWAPTKGECILVETDVEGLEWLQRARAAGRGVILWDSYGFGRRVVAKRALAARGIAIQQVHGPDNLGGFLVRGASTTWVRRALIKPFFEHHERKFIAEIITLPGSESLAFARHLRARLEGNAVLCVTGDGKVGRKLTPVRMLGGTEWFATGMVSLARMTGASILPMFCIQRKNGRTRVIIDSPIDIDTAANREDAVQEGLAQYARVLEGYIRRYPRHYRNWHLLGSVGA